MDKQTLTTIKNKLLQDKKNLEDRLQQFANKDKDVKDNYRTTFPDYGSKEDENAAEVATFSDNLSLEHTLELDLRDIKKAIRSIDEGKYGICKYCGQPIEEKRLLVRPTSTSCVECKKKLKGEIK